MLLTAGSPDALSFTDDTSLPKVGAKVSIHAQVFRDLPLDWYYALLQRAASHVGELKSTVIIKEFFSLADSERQRVLSTLKTVRIHVTDPRPYTRDVDQLLSHLVPGGNITGFIDRLDKAQQQLAEKKRRKLIAERMLRDAPQDQIRQKHLLWKDKAGLRIRNWPRQNLTDFDERPPKEFDFTIFERKGKNGINVLSAFLSKSESVFCKTKDGIDEYIERGTHSPIWVDFQLSRTLSESHAFDRGDTQAVQWIASERRDILRRIDRHGIVPQPAPLPELDSRDSFFVQASDFAAGIARETWLCKSLPHLIDTFQYVTYNGRRIFESEAVTIEAELAKRGDAV